MKTALTALALALISTSSLAATSFEDYAQVTNVSPNYVDTNQRQTVCEDVDVYTPGDNSSPIGSVIGGVAGGLLGNQVGKGNGRTTATAAGAVIGAFTGNNLGSSNGSASTRRQCHTVNNIVNQQSGYAVTFNYNGHVFTSILPRDPGPQVRLSIAFVAR